MVIKSICFEKKGKYKRAWVSPDGRTTKPNNRIDVQKLTKEEMI